jgi:hypothetical protein
MATDTGKPRKSFSEARQEIAGNSWLDDLARQSLTAAEAKFDPSPVPPEGEEQ